MEIFSKPVMNVAFEIEGQTGILPFHFVQTVDKHHIRKKLLVNWTFGKANEETREITFDSEMGELKKFMFLHLETEKGLMVRVFQGGDIKAKILETLAQAEDGQPLLLVWEKGVADEGVFYDALQLMKDGEICNPVHPIMFEETGFKINAPFRALSRAEFSA